MPAITAGGDFHPALRTLRWAFTRRQLMIGWISAHRSRIEFGLRPHRHEVMMCDELTSNITYGHPFMRTTLDIADDVLLAAKEVARREKKTIGEIVSDLARAALMAPNGSDTAARRPVRRLARFGIQPLPARGGIVSNELIDRLRDQEGI
jgi:hypothetical protein